MRIIYLKDEISEGPSCIALGNFDGCHLGHQELFQLVKKKSAENMLKSSVLLFNKHSKNLVDDNYKVLSSLDDKIDFLEKNGFDQVFVLDFDLETMNMSAESFIKDILVEKCKAKHIVVGEDYRFGHMATGNVSLLEINTNTYNFSLSIIKDICLDGLRISASRIKHLIETDEITLANRFLLRPYRISGKVIKGDGRGRTLGFPTANLKLLANYLVPNDGVYFTIAYVLGKKYYSLTSIGHNPTFDGQEHRIEIFIDDFNDNIYDDEISISFISKIRPTIKFSSREGLIKQMDYDYKCLLSYKEALQI